VAKNVMAKDK